jgi:hypothetical protein
MDGSGLVAKFLDRLDYGMVEVCIKDVTCGESLDWTPRHFDQGFAWRRGIVGFLAPDNFGTIQVHIWRGPAALRPDTIRAIRVPFTIRAGGRIEVSCGWGLSDAPRPRTQSRRAITRCTSPSATTRHWRRRRTGRRTCAASGAT